MAGAWSSWSWYHVSWHLACGHLALLVSEIKGRRILENDSQLPEIPIWNQQKQQLTAYRNNT